MNCRHCRAPLTTTVIDLGSSPPSNAYLTADQLTEPEAVFPLKVLVCTQCWLVQTEDFVGADTMFSDDYAYFSSYSESWLQRAEAYVHAMIERFELGHSDTVVEVAANDGYLLQFVRNAEISCYGVEPTHGTATAARERGIDIVEEFFGVDCATRLAHERRPKLMVANNVLAHVPDINDFVGGFTTLLAADGVATFEFPHLVNLIELNQFDTIYHEHYSYLSLTAVVAVFATNGLSVFDVEEIPTHGGSLRVFAQRSDVGSQPVSPSVARLLQAEHAAGVSTKLFYEQLQLDARAIAEDLVEFLRAARALGATVVAYGAAAKGNTMLNFAGIGIELIPFVVDRNPAKRGKYLPGSRIPIVGEDQLRATQPEFVLVLPWNLESEIREQLSYTSDWGAQFVTAVPHLSIGTK